MPGKLGQFALLFLPLYAQEDGRALARLYAEQVSRQLQLPAEKQQFYAAQLANLLPNLGSEFVALVDRNPKVQAFALFWRGPDKAFHYIGASPVSTGRPGRFEYFETPLGVFSHTLENPDFHAEGTRNEFGIRGYGIKGMRVFDFGWVKAPKGWGDRRESQMRLQMHATDPDLLEPHLGTARSKGCIRIPASLNVFLDRHGILDADYQRAVAEGSRPFVLKPDWNPTPWAGRFLAVVDSRIPLGAVIPGKS